MTAPFRADVVGSFLRPPVLLDARARHQKGEISRRQLADVEDLAIRSLVQRQRDEGLKVATDGEFRRSWWNLDFFWGLHGVEKTEGPQAGTFHGVKLRGDSAVLVDKLSGENHPFVDHFRFLKAVAGADVVPRQTIPSPTQFLHHVTTPRALPGTQAVYPNWEDLLRDIVKTYARVLKDLFGAGCRSVQFDDCSWGQFLEGRSAAFDPDRSTDDARKAEKVRVNNLVLDGRPGGLTITTHVCRGNFRSQWATWGGYEPIAEALFAEQRVDALYLEYDTDRAGGFEPLRFVSPEKKVVLGLVTSKTPDLEDVEALVARVHEAAKFVPFERLHLSPQCGFASTEEGNLLTEDQQWAKVRRIREVAEILWP